MRVESTSTAHRRGFSGAPDHSRFHFHVQIAGEAALRSLESGSEGEVLAVFRRSFYLRFAEGHVCIGPPSIGAGPLNAIGGIPEGMDWGASGLRQGDRAHGTALSVNVANRFSFVLQGTCLWHPASSRWSWSREGARIVLSHLADGARRQVPRDGLGRLVPLLVEGGFSTLRLSGSGGPFWAEAVKGAEALVRWLYTVLRDGDAKTSALSAEAQMLIGLGPGLTPSGDDFLGGAMIALRELGHWQIAEQLAKWVLPLARLRTSQISCAHLACAAGGQGAGALHDIIAAVHESDPDGISTALRAIDEVGHTSGWDALAGAAAVWGASFPVEPPPARLG